MFSDAFSLDFEIVCQLDDRLQGFIFLRGIKVFGHQRCSNITCEDNKFSCNIVACTYTSLMRQRMRIAESSEHCKAYGLNYTIKDCNLIERWRHPGCFLFLTFENPWIAQYTTLFNKRSGYTFYSADPKPY